MESVKCLCLNVFDLVLGFKVQRLCPAVHVVLCPCSCMDVCICNEQHVWCMYGSYHIPLGYMYRLHTKPEVCNQLVL